MRKKPVRSEVEPCTKTVCRHTCVEQGMVGAQCCTYPIDTINSESLAYNVDGVVGWLRKRGEWTAFQLVEHLSYCNTALQVCIRQANWGLAVHAHVLANDTKVLPARLASVNVGSSKSAIQGELQISRNLFILQR